MFQALAGVLVITLVVLLLVAGAARAMLGP